DQPEAAAAVAAGRATAADGRALHGAGRVADRLVPGRIALDVVELRQLGQLGEDDGELLLAGGRSLGDLVEVAMGVEQREVVEDGERPVAQERLVAVSVLLDLRV